MKTKFILTLCIITTVLTSVYSQTATNNRVEFDLKEEFSGHKPQHFGSSGIIISSINYSKKESYKYKVEKYSKDLKLIKTNYITIPKGYTVGREFKSENKWYAIIKNKNGETKILIVNPTTLESKKITTSIPIPPKFWGTKTSVNGNGLFITGTLKKAEIIYHINLTTGKTKLINVTYKDIKPKNIDIDNQQVLKNSKEFIVYLNISLAKKESEMIAVRYDENGKKTGTHLISKGLDYNLISASASITKPGEYIYSGTYSAKSTYSSQGVYILKVENNKRSFFKPYKFLELKGFLDYLPEKKKAKIEKKKSKKESKGKEFDLNYNIAQHNIKLINGKYILIGEAYYATYRTETYTTYVNGQAVTSTRQVFDGYQYTHAFVTAFNQKGEKLWNNTFELWSAYKPYYVKRFVQVSTKTKGKINLMFTSRDKITAKSIDQATGKTLISKDTAILKTGSEADKTKWTSSNLEYWYGKTFVAYGTQKIKNTDRKDDKKRKRTIFFINKISVK